MTDGLIASGDFFVHGTVQAVADLARKPMRELRVLDLGSQEGGYAIEFGLHGAEVVGIEGRAAHVDAARSAAAARGLDRVTFELGDVRELLGERLGRFDVVLCMGLVYHLEAADAVRLIERCFALCERMTVIRSAIGLSPNVDATVGGHRYRGRRYEEDAGEPGASIGNQVSILPTRASLLNLLSEVGFSSVLEIQVPFVPGLDDLRDSVTYVAMRGESTQFLSVPELNSVLPSLRRPERRAPSWIYAAAHPQQGPYWRVRERLLHTVERTIWRRGGADDWLTPSNSE